MKASEWQPIESAPKGGTKIDVWMHPYGYRITNVFWSYIKDSWCTESQHESDPTPIPRFPSPTHWMPLPEAPK